MKFNRAALQQAVEKAVEARRQQYDARLAELEMTRAEEAQRWVKESGPVWEAWLKKTLADLRKGKPVLAAGVPGYNSRSNHGAYYPTRRETEEYKVPQELHTMRALLPTIADEVVTTAGLKELGISPATVRMAAVHMPPATVSN